MTLGRSDRVQQCWETESCIQYSKFIQRKNDESRGANRKRVGNYVEDCVAELVYAKTCRVLVESQLQRAPFLVEDVTIIIKKTRGRCTWRNLSVELSGGKGNLPLVSHVTMMKFVMSLPDSSYNSTSILPKLDELSKRRRYCWAPLGFWIFCTLKRTIRLRRVGSKS